YLPPFLPPHRTVASKRGPPRGPRPSRREAGQAARRHKEEEHPHSFGLLSKRASVTFPLAGSTKTSSTRRLPYRLTTSPSFSLASWVGGPRASSTCFGVLPAPGVVPWLSLRKASCVTLACGS